MGNATVSLLLLNIPHMDTVPYYNEINYSLPSIRSSNDLSLLFNNNTVFSSKRMSRAIIETIT